MYLYIYYVFMFDCDIYTLFSSNSEADASEFLENIE